MTSNYHRHRPEVCLSIKCHTMSRKRQHPAADAGSAEDERPIRTFCCRHLSGYVIPPHSHDWHQLIYATQGVMSVRTAHGSWVIPPHRAVWVPAAVEHTIEMCGAVMMQTVYVAPGLSESLPRGCCAVNVSPLLRELIVHTVSLGMLDRAVPAQARLIGVLLDQVHVLPVMPLKLPMPTDPRARRVAAWLQDHQAAPGPLKQLRKTAACSKRTLERLFLTETGLTFGKWRQQLKLLYALRLLAAGKPVTTVALEVGYDSPSAFIAMFRRSLGATPSRYFAAGEGSGSPQFTTPSRVAGSAGARR
jgi:AraC-like DNA-binding protein